MSNDPQLKDFWKLYKRALSDFPSNCKEAGGAAREFGEHLLVISLPLTFPIIYPLIVLWRKVKK